MNRHKVVKVNRYYDQFITIQVIIGKKVWSIILVYTPQVGRPQNKKEAFLEELETILDNIPRSEKILIGCDFNAYLGAQNKHYPEEYG